MDDITIRYSQFDITGYVSSIKFLIGDGKCAKFSNGSFLPEFTINLILSCNSFHVDASISCRSLSNGSSKTPSSSIHAPVL